MVEAEADQKIANRVGAALGFKESGGFNVAGSNSLYGAKSQALSTQEKYLTQGGIDKSVNIDKMESAQKAANQEGSVKGTQEQADKIGKAVGKEVKDVLKDVANAMAQSKVKSDYNTIQGAGGAQNYIKASGDAATEKGTSLEAQSEALRKHNKKDQSYLDEKGNITQEGKDALKISSVEKLQGMMGKKNIGDEGTDKFLEDIGNTKYAEYVNAHKHDKGMTQEKLERGARAFARRAIEPYMDEKGNALKGDDFWGQHAELKAGSFMSSNSMVLGDGSSFSGVISTGGTSGTTKSGMSSMRENTNTNKAGDSTVLNATSKETWQNLKASNNPENASETANQRNENDGSFDILGTAKSMVAEVFGDGAEPVIKALGLGAGAWGINEFSKRSGIGADGIKLPDSALGKLDEVLDKDGNLRGYSKKGDTSGKLVANRDGFLSDENGKKKTFGVGGRMFNGGIVKANELKSFTEQSHNKTNDPQTKSTDNPVNDKVQHDKSPSSFDNNSITQNEPKSDKKVPIKEEISKEFKNNLENNKEALKNAERIRDNKLAVASTVEAKQKALTEFAQTKAELGGTKINDVKADAFKVEDSAIKEATEKAHKPSGFMKTVTDTFDNIVDGVKNAKTSKKLAVAGATAVTVGAVAGNSTSTTVAREEAKDILTPTDENSGLISAETTSKLVDGGALAFNGLTAKAGMEEMKSGMKSTQFLSDVFIYNIAIL